MDAATLAEIGEWIEPFKLNKLEVFGVFCVILFFWRLPVILQHRGEVREIELEAGRKSRALDGKIAREQERRETRKGGVK